MRTDSLAPVLGEGVGERGWAEGQSCGSGLRPCPSPPPSPPSTGEREDALMTTAVPANLRTSPGVARRLLGVRELPIAVVLAVVVLATALREPRFLASENVGGILSAVALVLV